MDLEIISIGTRIKDRRIQLGLTQTEIFQHYGIDTGTLSKIENGTRTPSVLLFYKIAQALKCDMEWLVTGHSANPQISLLCEKEELLLNSFRKLPDDEKIDVQDYIDFKLHKSKSDQDNTPRSSDSATIENKDMAI